MRRTLQAAAIRRWVQIRGPRWGAILLCALIVLDCLNFGLWSWSWRVTELRLKRPHQASTTAIFGPPRESGVARLLEAHLFGTAAPTVPVVIDAPQDLKLLGTIASSDEHKGSAIIGTGSGVPRLYAVGSLITPALRLSAVYPDHVVIDRDSATSVLRLPHFPGWDGRQGGRPPKEQLAANGSAEPGLASDTDRSFDPPPMPASGAIIRSLNFLPAIEHGKRVGMRIGTSHDGARVRQLLGINSGDVVVALNGESVADQPGGGVGELMRAINAADSVTLTVERQGQQFTIAIDPSRAGMAASAFNNFP